MDKKKLEIAPLSILDNIVISKSEVWAYYVLADKPFDFLSQSAQIELAQSIMNALSGLCSSAVHKVDCHLLIVNQPFSVEGWAEQMITSYDRLIKKENMVFDKFVEEQAWSLYDGSYRKRVTYLGVKLMSRRAFDLSSANILEFGFKEAFSILKKNITQFLKFNAEEISELEEDKVYKLEEEIYRKLANSFLQVRKPASEEVLLTIKERFYPAMPTPYLETSHTERIGLNDIVIETGGTIEENSRWLKFTQFIDSNVYEGYRASLIFSKFKKEISFPSVVAPFLYRKEILGLTVNCRFSLIPTEQMRKQRDKRQRETDDEIANLEQSSQKRAPVALTENLHALKELGKSLELDEQPWVQGHYRLVVEAPTEKELKDYVTFLKGVYDKDDIVLTWSTGDQLKLWQEELLGSSLQVGDFGQTTNMAILGVAGINYGDSAGDPVRKKLRFTRRK